jgi:hypothetical protein
MATRAGRTPVEEVARRGEEIYHRAIRPTLSEDHRGKAVAIDIHSGDFVIGKNTLDTVPALRARHPDAEIWCRRIGFRTYHWHHGRAEQEPI